VRALSLRATGSLWKVDVVDTVDCIGRTRLGGGQGSAFQRWLLPGWGSTVLGVRGAHLDKQSGVPAAVITYQRNVHFGGLFTVGAR